MQTQLSCMAILLLCWTTVSSAQVTSTREYDEDVIRRWAHVQTEGVGGSIIAMLGQLSRSGDYEFLTGSFGFGVSFKPPSSETYPPEYGLYIAPQFSTLGTHVSLLAHATLFYQFGFGVGYRFYSGQLDGPTSDNLYLTVGVVLTNAK